MVRHGLVQCLLCECSTLEESLVTHIQYNHMIYRKAIRDVLHSLHFPPVPTHLIDVMVEACKKRSSGERGKLSPFHRGKRSLSKNSGTGRKRSASPIVQAKRLKPDTPVKKPIVIKKPTPARKKLQPNLNQMLEEDANENHIVKKTRKKSEEVDYDSVYSRRENSERATCSILKIRQLQQNELMSIMDNGTHVQCCECNKWRNVQEYEDPSLVPEYWVCSMNKDESINDCNKGEGDDVESDEEFVSVEYCCGSMVWVKFAGYPWWPGMVDYCPEEEETFLVDHEVDPKVAARYHVVFFDKANNVARAWVDREHVVKMGSVEEPPKVQQNFRNDKIKKRFHFAKTMAADALNLPRIERIEKYSFATLFTGKWADVSDDEESYERRSTEIDIDVRLVGVSDFKEPQTPVRKKPEPRKIKRKKKTLKEKRFMTDKKGNRNDELGWEPEQDFECLRCGDSVKFARNFVTNHLRKHRLSIQEYLARYDSEDTAERLYRVRQWVQNEEYVGRISDIAKERRESLDKSRNNSEDDVDELLNETAETEDGECSFEIDREDEITSVVPQDWADIPIEIPLEDSLNDIVDSIVSIASSNNSEIETKNEPVELTEAVNDEQSEDSGPNITGLASEETENTANHISSDEPSTDNSESQISLPVVSGKARIEHPPSKMPRKTGEEEISPTEVEAVIKEECSFIKPPMSPELMIAIAVRNLDPYKEVGASCSDIVAFLSLHFPYFSFNYEECKDMVRRECGLGSEFQSGKENFQMRAEINCGERIHSYVQNNRDRICQSMLEPEFLDVIIDRFISEDRMVSSRDRGSPPFNQHMLTHLALLKLSHHATLEQIVMLLKFIFPALAETGVMESFRKEFLEVIAKSKELDARVEKDNITFRLREDHKEEVLESVKQFALNNLEAIGESLLHESFFDIIIPIFQGNE